MPTQPPIHRPPGWRPPAEVRRASDKARAPSNARIYGSAWRKLRNRFIAVHPNCAHSECTALAAEVDHIVSVRERPDLRLEWSNLRSLCKRHHSSRTARDQGMGRAKRDNSAFD